MNLNMSNDGVVSYFVTQSKERNSVFGVPALAGRMGPGAFSPTELNARRKSGARRPAKGGTPNINRQGTLD